MKTINVCPGTLAQGFDTYSQICLRKVFNGKKVSHIIDFSLDNDTENVISSVNKISISLWVAWVVSLSSEVSWEDSSEFSFSYNSKINFMIVRFISARYGSTSIYYSPLSSFKPEERPIKVLDQFRLLNNGLYSILQINVGNRK